MAKRTLTKLDLADICDAIRDAGWPTRLLTYKEAADCFNASVGKVRKMVAAGELKTVHLGPKCVRIHPAEMARCFRRNTQ